MLQRQEEAVIFEDNRLPKRIAVGVIFLVLCLLSIAAVVIIGFKIGNAIKWNQKGIMENPSCPVLRPITRKSDMLKQTNVARSLRGSHALGDGNLNTCFQSEEENSIKHPYYRFELGAIAMVYMVRVYPNPESLFHDVEVRVGTQNDTTEYEGGTLYANHKCGDARSGKLDPKKPYDFVCSKYAAGSVVSIQMFNTEECEENSCSKIVDLCEIEIYGYKVENKK